MTFDIQLGYAWEFDILQFKWNSLALFPVIVWGIHIWLFQPEVEEDRKKSKIGMHKEGIISAGCGLIAMLFIGV